MLPATWRQHAGAVLAYAVAALLFTWPLCLHLKTHLTGSPAGDTGVYVWNQWVFRHEILTEHRIPLRTGRILTLNGPTHLAFHNYTTFANVLAFPLRPMLGVVGTFNVVYLVLATLTSAAMYVLARRLTRGAGIESWLAGLLFAWSPMLLARGTAHFSLVAAAPLPIFVLLLMRTAERER